ncbi:MAG: 16S rRNA (guanine(966)-N(2))-methyltransferase RsmD [Oligosphaeraceae bacterium]|nr:16S rRNA (guanine(966)-N(2))-methyltransferase RsmD [Oligosphaeraceae bacterium]
MRIIGGRAGGIRLSAPKGDSLRPSEGRVKEALFAALGDLHGLQVLDLFAGVGSLGLEALSRGAAKVVFLEKLPRHVQYIAGNLANVSKAMNGEHGETEIICADAADCSTRLTAQAGCFDIILADPPYDPPPGEFGGKELLMQAEFASWCKADCRLILEHDKHSVLPYYPASSWQLQKEKHYGRRSLCFLQKMEPNKR